MLASIRSICSLPDPSLLFRPGGVPVLYVLEWDHYTCLRHCRPSASQRWRATTCTKRRHYCYLRSIAFQTWQRPLRRIALPSRFTQAKTLVQRVRRERRLFLACLSRGYSYCTSADRPGAHSSRMRMQGVGSTMLTNELCSGSKWKRVSFGPRPTNRLSGRPRVACGDQMSILK